MRVLYAKHHSTSGLCEREPQRVHRPYHYSKVMGDDVGEEEEEEEFEPQGGET